MVSPTMSGLYGRRDFEERLRSAGLEPEAVRVGDVVPDWVDRAALDPTRSFTWPDRSGAGMTRILHVDHTSVLGGANGPSSNSRGRNACAATMPVVAVGRYGPFASALEEVEVPITILAGVAGSRRHRTRRRLPSSQPAQARPRCRCEAATSHSRRRPSIVHAHTRKAQLVSSFAQPGSGAPLVWHLRDDVPRRAAVRLLLRLAMRRVAHAVALSTWLADHYRAEGLLPRSGRIDIVSSGVDPASLSGIETPWLDGQRPPVVGFLGQADELEGTAPDHRTG